mgnify:CR=1 FL=1
MSEKLLVPDIGDFDEVEVIEILVKQGDQLNTNDPVITIESDKSSVEIPSTVSGKIELVAVKVGDKVSKGDLILSIASSGENKKSVPIPKDTENIIKQAEVAIAEKEEVVVASKESAQKKEQSIIQVTNGNDIDPLETQDWLESLSAVILKDEDIDMREMAEGEVVELKKRTLELEGEIKKLLLPKDPDDSKDVFLEVRAGAGGDEAALFAGDLFRMYSRLA